MDDTPNLMLPYIMAAQAQKHVTHNEAIRALDAIVQIGVLDRDLTAPPGSPADGDSYIVAAGATGAWAGNDGQIAAWQDGAWIFYAPREGWLAWVADEDLLLVWDGASWSGAEDHEEGTWTPTLQFGGASTGITYVAQTGRYSKIGNAVLVRGYFALSNKGSAAGNMTVAGLPFSPDGGAYAYGLMTAAPNACTGLSGAVFAYVFPGNSALQVYQTNTGAFTAITDANCSSGTDCTISGAYFI